MEIKSVTISAQLDVRMQEREAKGPGDSEHLLLPGIAPRHCGNGREDRYVCQHRGNQRELRHRELRSHSWKVVEPDSSPSGKIGPGGTRPGVSSRHSCGFIGSEADGLLKCQWSKSGFTWLDSGWVYGTCRFL